MASPPPADNADAAAARRSARSNFEFQAPSRKVAMEYADKYHPRTLNGRPLPICCGTRTGRHCFPALDYRKGKSKGCGYYIRQVFDPFREGIASDLAVLGPGITLHFKFMKFAFWLFFILTLISLPELYINVSAHDAGAGSSIKSSSMLKLEATMIGSLASFFPNGTYVDEETPLVMPMLCESPDRSSFACELEKGDLRYIYLYTEVAVVFVYFWAALLLKHFHKRETRHVAKTCVTLEEYTVCVKHLPPKVTETDLKTFFESLHSERVAEVVLCRSNDSERISSYKKKAKLLGDLWKIAGRIHFLDKRGEGVKGWLWVPQSSK